MEDERTYTAFVGENLVASGPLETMLPALKAICDRDESALFLVFEDQTGRQVDFNLRGALNDVIARARPPQPRSGPGRPKLGVVSREVSLLPRHWAWLEEQPNGASAALRRLVDQARKQEPGKQRARVARESVGRLMSAMAGDRPGYEEASRALYAGNRKDFEALIRAWPHDIRAYIQSLDEDAFGRDELPSSVSGTVSK